MSCSVPVRSAMDPRAATQQARSGLVVRQNKLFQEGGRVTVACSRKKCCRASFLVAALMQGEDTRGRTALPLLARPGCSEWDRKLCVKARASFLDELQTALIYVNHLCVNRT